eukprot:2140545-Prymnesium_polylepis.1
MAGSRGRSRGVLSVGCEIRCRPVRRFRCRRLRSAIAFEQPAHAHAPRDAQAVTEHRDERA